MSTVSCQKEDVISEANKPTSKPFAYKTVPIGEAISLFSNTNTSANKSNGSLNLQPDLNAIKQESIQYTKEYMTNIPAVTKNKNINTNIILIKYKDSIIRSLINLIPSKESNSQKFSGIVSITTLSGKFINGYRLKDGVFVSQFIKLNTKNISGKTLTDPIVACDEGLDPSSIFCDQSLGETDLGSVPASTGSSSPNPALFLNLATDIPFVLYSAPDYSLGGSNSGSSGSGGVTVYPCNDPIHGCSIDSLPPTTSKPCPGNPVKNPEIAPQKNSGVQGGMYGYTRKEWNKTHTKLIDKFHNGIDIKNSYGSPIYAMYDGTAKPITQYKKGKVYGAGHYVEVTSTINGQSVKILYFHMQQNNRASGLAKAGDIIGYQGVSGNLGLSISQGLSVSHVHIKVKINNITSKPYAYITTKFDLNTGEVIQKANCN